MAKQLGRSVTAATALGAPVFAQPAPSPDPTNFTVTHPSDGPAYAEIDKLNREHKLFPMPFPAPRGLPEPQLTLAQVLDRPNADAPITAAGQIVFHAVGDTGNTKGPASQSLVADKLISDFHESDAAQIPLFCLHLGDVIYSFGEAQYYYDQFYEPYREYPAPILALAGNHDGMVAPGSGAKTLDAFLNNFCQQNFVVTPEAGGLSRTAQIQPGVFFTLEAPFVRILALYSNTLEDPGVIANDQIGNSQLDYLRAALNRVKTEKYQGALILAHHHPSYTAGSVHGWSVDLTAQIDQICTETGIWPHAVLSGHAHNYQRFTRAQGAAQIPYLIAGDGGHGLARLGTRGGQPLRVPTVIQAGGAKTDQVTLESYDDQDYGYLRVIASATQLRIEYHPATDGAAAKTPDDAVTVDLATRRLTT
ncbi:MAG: calcineurin-like phosphoesterase family protein [Rhodospirillales bacterium]|nr:calcineurin-like phosphoesterase family protein [Rhodospirillales bacterium]